MVGDGSACGGAWEQGSLVRSAPASLRWLAEGARPGVPHLGVAVARGEEEGADGEGGCDGKRRRR